MTNMSNIDINSLLEQMNINAGTSVAYEIDEKLHNLEVNHITDTIFPDNSLQTDCDLSSCKTMQEVEERVNCYARVFSRFYDGEEIEFDATGMQQTEKAMFSENSIGKSTVKVPVEQKQQAQAQVSKDIQELEQGVDR